MYLRTHAHNITHIHAHTHIHTHMPACTRARTHTHTHTLLYDYDLACHCVSYRFPRVSCSELSCGTNPARKPSEQSATKCRSASARDVHACTALGSRTPMGRTFDNRKLSHFLRQMEMTQLYKTHPRTQRHKYQALKFGELLKEISSVIPVGTLVPRGHLEITKFIRSTYFKLQCLWFSQHLEDTHFLGVFPACLI